MKPIGCERLRRIGTGALVLLLVHGLGTTRWASAACNHLVTSKMDHPAEFSRFDALITGDGDGSATIAGNPTPDPLNPLGPKHQGPCSGPGCSSRVPMPAPPAFPDSDRSDPWVVLNAVVHLPLASPPCRTSDEPAGRPGGVTPSIFHPPRA
ncbi:MAG TPA: hypothetical protein VFF52_27390 [Isosphaeraceae bacterium]|nr:hypothetical protein [Isosphaeraceae bacterium]